MRLLTLILIIFTLLLALFLTLGGHRFFDPAATLDLFERHQQWAIPLGFALMMTDLVLPIPSSAVMNWFGIAYGPLLGGLLGSAACIASSSAAYWLSRLLGRRAAQRIAGPDDLQRTQLFFARWGSLAVAAARPLPMIAEAVYCLAGLSRMPFGRFLLATTIGSLPFALAFAWLGHAGRQTQEPLFYLALSVLIPAALWPPIYLLLRRHKK